MALFTASIRIVEYLRYVTSGQTLSRNTYLDTRESFNRLYNLAYFVFPSSFYPPAIQALRNNSTSRWYLHKHLSRQAPLIIKKKKKSFFLKSLLQSVFLLAPLPSLSIFFFLSLSTSNSTDALPAVRTHSLDMPLLEMSPNVVEPEASRKRTHDEFTGDLKGLEPRECTWMSPIHEAGRD